MGRYRNLRAGNTGLPGGPLPGPPSSPPSSAAPLKRMSKIDIRRILRRDRRLATDAFIFGDNLRAEQQQNSADLHRKHRENRGRQRPIDDAHLGHGAVVPSEQM